MGSKPEIQLIIKAPNQNIDDQTIDCGHDWSICDLKVHLSEVYPSKPAVNEQKLIYCGRLLPDELHLKEFLRQEGEGEAPVQTLHLVCSKQGRSTGNTPGTSGSSTSQNVPSPSTRNTSVPPPQVLNAMEDGVRQRQVGSSNNESASGATNMPSGPSPFSPNMGGESQMSYLQQLYTVYSSQQYPVSNAPVGLPVESPSIVQYNMASQMAAYQQLYTNYYAQMMRNLQVGGNAVPVPPSAAPVVENVNIPAPAAQVPRNRNIQLNAQGGVDDHDDGANWDWLDYFYFCCRGFLFFSIVYYYSSPERLLLVVGLAVMALLYQEGWLMARNRQNRPNENQANRPRQQPPENNENPTTEDGVQQNQNDTPTERDIEEINEIEATMDGDTPAHMQDRHPTNTQNPALTFIMSFFSSLIPDPPPPVNIN